MSKAQASRAKPRYNPIHTKPPQTPTPGPSLLFVSYNPHAQVKKRDVAHPRRRDVVEAIGNQPLGIEPLHGMQWLYQESEGFQAYFWQFFFAPVGTTVRNKNPWPRFKSLATTVLEEHGWDSFLTPSEIWNAIRRERPDIERSWFDAAYAIDADNTAHPAAPPKRKRRRRSNYQGVIQAQLPMAPLPNAGYLSPLWACIPQNPTFGAYPASANLGPSCNTTHHIVSQPLQRPVSRGPPGWAPSGSGEYQYLHQPGSSPPLSTSSSSFPSCSSNYLARETLPRNSSHLPEVPGFNVQLPMASTSSAGLPSNSWELNAIPAWTPQNPTFGAYPASANLGPSYSGTRHIVSQPHLQRPVSQGGQGPDAPLSNNGDVWDGSPHQSQPKLDHQSYNFDPGYCSIEPNARPTAYPYPSSSEFSATSLLVPDQLSYPYVDHSEVEPNFIDLPEGSPRTETVGHDLSASPTQNVQEFDFNLSNDFLDPSVDKAVADQVTPTQGQYGSWDLPLPQPRREAPPFKEYALHSVRDKFESEELGRAYKEFIEEPNLPGAAHPDNKVCPPSSEGLSSWHDGGAVAENPVEEWILALCRLLPPEDVPGPVISPEETPFHGQLDELDCFPTFHPTWSF